MKLKTIPITLFVLILIGLIGYRITEQTLQLLETTITKLIKQPTMVHAIVLSEKDFSNVISLSGSIEANEMVEIRSEVSGIVEQNLLHRRHECKQRTSSIKSKRY